MNNKFDNIIQAGRVINDISIDDLVNDYKRKVFDLISLLKFKTIVLDFDGTMTEFKYNENRLLPCRDDDLFEYSKEYNIYKNAKVLKTIQYVLNELYDEEIFILTVTVDTLKENKLKIIKSNFNIKEENIIQVSNTNEKMKALEEIYKKTNKRIIFLEDTAKTLLNAEEQFDFVKGYHISSLIP